MKDTGRKLYPDGLGDAIKFGAVDDLRLRFSLAARLAKMAYGEAVAIPHDIVMHAWPPTGDHDRSDRGFWLAMSLAASGNRQVESYTTQERIMRDLDDTFHVERMNDREGRWLIERKLRCCPRCHGDGYYDVWDMSDTKPLFAVGPADFTAEMSATVSKKRIKCDHSQERKD